MLNLDSSISWIARMKCKRQCFDDSDKRMRDFMEGLLVNCIPVDYPRPDDIKEVDPTSYQVIENAGIYYLPDHMERLQLR